MKKRQDMFSNQILGFIWPSEDQVFLEIGIESEQKIEAIIMKTNNAKQTLNDMPHLKKFVKKIPNEGLEKVGLSLFAESEESAKCAFSQQVIDSIIKNSSSIHVLHLTDQKCYSPYSLVLKVGLNIGETKETHENAAKLFNSVITQFVDSFAKVQLSAQAINTSKKNREADEKKQNQEKQKKIEEEAQKK